MLNRLEVQKAFQVSMLVAVLALGCTYGSTDADRLAAEIELRATAVAASTTATEVEFEYQPAATSALVAILPGNSEVTDQISEQVGSSTDLELLRQIHSRRHSGSSTLSIVTEDGWSTIDYVDRFAKPREPQLARIDVDEVLRVKLVGHGQDIELTIGSAKKQ